MALLAGAVVIATGIALASAGVIGAAIPIVLGFALGPFLIVGLALGTDRGTARIVAFAAAGAVLVYVVLSAFVSTQPPAPPAAAGGGLPTTPDTDPGVIIGLGGLGVVVAIIAILILVRLWMGQIGPVEADVHEIRMIDHGETPTTARRSPRRRRRNPTPVDAAGAYVALMDEIEGRPVVRRDPAETPAEHARRLRGDGLGELALDLLAADYALVRFGGIVLSEREDRRAIGRWRMLRSRLGRT